MFSIRKKGNFEGIGNFTHTTEFLILGKALQIILLLLDL